MIEERFKASLRHLLRVLDPKGTRCCIARVGQGRNILFGQLIIILLETFLAHHHLTTNFYLLNPIVGKSSEERDGSDLPEVYSNFIALYTITSCCSSYKQIVFINERDTRSIKFW